MTTDAIALLPARLDTGHGRPGDWLTGIGPKGAIAAWRALTDGTLVNLALPFATDAGLHEAARRWMEPVPDRIWVFPDSAVPDLDSSAAILSATREVGRWVLAAAAAPKAAPAPIEQLGFSADEARAWQADMASGDRERMAAAMKMFERRLADRDPAEIEGIIAAALRR